MHIAQKKVRTGLGELSENIQYSDSPPVITGLDEYKRLDAKCPEAKLCPVNFEIAVSNSSGGFKFKVIASEQHGVEVQACHYSGPRFMAPSTDPIKPDDMRIVQERVKQALPTNVDLRETIERIPQLAVLLGCK